MRSSDLDLTHCFLSAKFPSQPQGERVQRWANRPVTFSGHFLPVVLFLESPPQSPQFRSKRRKSTMPTRPRAQSCPLPKGLEPSAAAPQPNWCRSTSKTSNNLEADAAPSC